MADEEDAGAIEEEERDGGGKRTRGWRSSQRNNAIQNVPQVTLRHSSARFGFSANRQQQQSTPPFSLLHLCKFRFPMLYSLYLNHIITMKSTATLRTSFFNI